MRMVKCINGRKGKNGCKLDPVRVNDYSHYFISTFGSEPLGNLDYYLPDEHLDENFAPIPLFTMNDIREATGSLKLGKAAGVDGLPGEFYKLGGESIIRVLTKLFNILLDSDIPDQWNEALIVPVYKNKGADNDIANYRPIALTCVVRRLFEKAFSRHLEAAAIQLSDFQGGFRHKRSTLDSVFCLHEVMLEHPDMVSVFLDLKAAYDLVDRRVLFIQLRKMKLSSEVIKVLEKLFNNNKSYLIVKGRKSEPIYNLRGLLQGSSLSPLLFNLFINELIQELDHRDSPKLLTSGLRTNCFFFADDGNLHARNRSDMVRLLGICEQWSNRVGMVFAPAKCFVLSRKKVHLTLYGNELPQPETVEYLGIAFNWQGIRWSAHVSKRVKKATNLLSVLSGLGLNVTGWPQRSSILVYKSFLRSTLEYGIGLSVLSKEHIQMLQKVQNASMRAILSCHRTGSISGMHRLLQLETMQERNYHLNIGFATRLHNSRDSSKPAVNMWWSKVTDIGTRSLANICKNKNPLWAKCRKLNHVLNRRRRGVDNPEKGFSLSTKKRLVKESIVNNIDRELSVAAALQVESNDPIRHCLLPNAFQDKKTRVTILRWIIGGVANHQVCKKCQREELSRNHAVECSGALEYLKMFYPDHYEENNSINFISVLLNIYRNGPADVSFYERIATAVSMIYKDCLGYQQKETGFWKSIEEQENRPRGPVGERQVRPLVQARAITERRRQIALLRNRPNGRPRRGIG
jgi:Reverse transcriptase (RNA-dependent DNA polymerase)